MSVFKKLIKNLLLKNNTNTKNQVNKGSVLTVQALKYDKWYAHYKNIVTNIDKFQKFKILLESDYKNKRVLDFGGAAGQFAVALLEFGALSAIVQDVDLPINTYNKTLNNIKNLHVYNLTIEELAHKQPNSVDLVIAHTVTEHIINLPSAFSAIKKIMAPNAIFFIAHDNYYHASGAHDYSMLKVGKSGLYEYLGPKCWLSKKRCNLSLDWRKNMRKNRPWTWDKKRENLLNPKNCINCPFYKRTYPWSHLLWQDNFDDYFHESAFSTGRTGSRLNKVTPFQLAQFLVEAGFHIEIFKRTFINNDPPTNLLKEPFFSAMKI